LEDFGLLDGSQNIHRSELLIQQAKAIVIHTRGLWTETTERER
jgi:hypothetical protein